MAPEKKIVLISSGQPSLNPRLVKEADALTDAGYAVTVLYAYWNDWGTLHDEQLFAKKKWSAIRLGGDPEQKRFLWFLSRLIHRLSRFMVKKTGAYKTFGDFAISRSSYFLKEAAKNYNGDLYIAHNLGALPAAAHAAAWNNKPFGFDAEDFHRQEIDDDLNSFHYKICTYLEDKYLPGASYITASSPMIADQYAALYKRTVTAILNVFPLTAGISIVKNEKKPLKLFWFSQTIGPGRGLELVVQAIGQSGVKCELHLLGKPVEGYKQSLSQLAHDAGIANYNLYFYEPVKASQIFSIASQFDIGLASETGSCLNRDISLTNKIFTYIQCGLAVAASNTRAQNSLLEQYSQTGKVYKNASDLSAILAQYHKNRELLYQTKTAAWQAGQTELNWETESRKFLKVIENV
ncbi:hypothetical protein [Mucilaginibacter gotjawali]|uniref:Glycosyltransferase involved in cell wall biosynthesis n=1 Tax=Mucilaginibacter gotjawali TaxID=1550579 RepID=A0A839SGZ7_9SPHI|nr:hypothetical protein [Mucilaginibacter gotjawali]MBB3057106.1 glycosyltransferase involved in cell wall biosynthesis [Mucilaginibacter gotjawali]